MYLYVYQKPDGDIIHHINYHLRYDDKTKGEITSNGWEIISVQIYYEGRFYSLKEHWLLTHKKKKRYRLRIMITKD